MSPPVLEPPIPRRVAEIDWEAWTARDHATLVFIVAGDRMLLIRKKRGLGAGKINAAGGRLEPGEAPEAGAVREVEEELRITPKQLRHCGTNSFQFVDGYSIHVHVYRSDAFEGEPTETPEAVPLWFPISALPFQEMWEDDVLWVPRVLEGRPFLGRYVFDGDRMLDHAIELAGSW